MDKVLIGVPTYDGKSYCQDDFFKNLRKIDYPSDILFVDNSSTIDNCQKIIKEGFQCIYNRPIPGETIKNLAQSHNILREMVLRKDYDWLLHIESDILDIPRDIVYTLLSHGKYLVSGWYDIDEGTFRQPGILIADDDETGYVKTMKIGKQDAIFAGTGLKICFNAGLGCTLIHRSVLRDIPFRFEPNKAVMPDYWFAQDCYTKNIEFHVDTNIYLRHENKDWGLYKVDYK